MANGLRVYNPSGQIRLDVTDRLTRVLYTRYLPLAESGGVAVPGFDPAKGVAFAMPIPPFTEPRAAHIVTASVGYVSWAPVTTNVYYGANSMLVVLMYA